MLRVQAMKHLFASFAAGMLCLPALVNAQEGGQLSTMPHGNYQCALPGSAAGNAWTPIEAENFRLSSASRYRSATGRGTYLLKGDYFTFTRGPRKGERFIREGENRLRKLDQNGDKTRLLCVRRG